MLHAIRMHWNLVCLGKQKNKSLVWKKGGPAAFFLRGLAICLAAIFAPHLAYASQASIAEQVASSALHAGLSKQPTWAALLHVASGKAYISDSGFLLSGNNFSLENELLATITLFYPARTRGEVDRPNLAVCRFPARYLWMRSQIDLPALPIAACEELNEFKKRAPADEISVVFASENLAQPASMMGHVFLKLSGLNEKQQQVRHAVSFITDAGGKNVAKLFFDSIVVGKQGFFTLGPYEEKLDVYLRTEQRSLWEYQLALSSVQRELVQAHLMELKQTRLSYFFQHYNCATVVDFILAVASGQPLPEDGLWITPKDVVKRLDARGLIQSSQILPPNRWIIRAISEQLTAAERERIQADVDNYRLPVAESKDLDEQFIHLQLAKAYHGYRVETKQADSLSAEMYSKALRALEYEKFPTMRLETTSFKNPIATPQDSQTEFGLQRREGGTFVRFGFTPVSHHLGDDNRQYFAENELLLLDFSILKELGSSKVALDQFVLYGAKSLIPHDAMSGGISGAFRLGITPQRDSDFLLRRNVFVEGAVGLTKRIGQDVDVFALAGAGMSAGRSGFNLYALPEVGLVVREVFDLKTLASVQLTANALGKNVRSTKYRFEQAKFFPNQNFSLHLTAELLTQSPHREHFVEFGVKYYF